jgi:hypothetical protein
MEIISYNELVDDAIFFNFLKTESLEVEQPASVNIWSDNWETSSNTLPYLLSNGKRFDGVNGEFYILFKNDVIVACGGVYISDFDQNIAIAGVRTWVSKEYRHLSLNKDYLLTEQKKWAIGKNMKIIALSFNEYNKNIIQIFKRNRLGEKTGRINSRNSKNMFYNGVNEVPFQVTIQHTPQWVIYEKIDENFNFDWTKLK